MPSAYKIDKQDGAYFITSTIVGWIDLFIRDSYKQLIADSLNFCIEKKGLQIYAYVIMPSHLHLIASAKNNDLSDVIGSFKKFTCNKLLNNIKTSKESRRDCLPANRQGYFRFLKKQVKKIQGIHIIKSGNKTILPACKIQASNALRQAGMPKKFIHPNSL